LPRPTLFDHPKFHRLVHILALPEPYVLGHLEYLWRVGYASGNPFIGDSLDVEIAAKWKGERGVLTRALLEVRLLDEISENQFRIHDLHDNAPDYVRSRARQEAQRKRQRQASLERKQATQAQIDQLSRNGHVTVTDGLRDTNASPAPAPTPIKQIASIGIKTETRSSSSRARQEPVWTPAKTPNGNGHGAIINGAEVRRHGSHAWCSSRAGLCVPVFLHEEFKGKGAKTAEQLTAWYASTVERFGTAPIGEDALVFWRNEFAAWVGTATSAPSTNSKSARTMAGAKRQFAREQAQLPALNPFTGKPV